MNHYESNNFYILLSVIELFGDTMKEVMPKEGAAHIQPGSNGSGTANKVSTSRQKTVSPSGYFVRTGRIEMEKSALRLTYEAFGKMHTAYIAARDLDRILQPGAPPVKVIHIRTGIDGEEVTDEIGTAWRSRSGRALMIRTIDSDGEIMASFSKVRQLTHGEVGFAYLSRFPDKPKASPTKPSTLGADLQGAF